MNTPNTAVITPAPPPPAEALSSRPATILLVEDDRALRRYLEVTLQRAGYRVITASDGLEGIKAALSSEINAVVTDAIMPHLGGHELCRFLRRHPTLGQLPVVILSGSEPADASRVAEDADVYLSKPVQPEKLNACLARLVRHTD